MRIWAVNVNAAAVAAAADQYAFSLNALSNNNNECVYRAPTTRQTCNRSDE